MHKKEGDRVRAGEEVLNLKIPAIDNEKARPVKRSGFFCFSLSAESFYAGLKIISQAWAIKILIIMYGKAVFINPIKDIL